MGYNQGLITSSYTAPTYAPICTLSYLYLCFCFLAQKCAKNSSFRSSSLSYSFSLKLYFFMKIIRVFLDLADFSPICRVVLLHTSIYHTVCFPNLFLNTSENRHFSLCFIHNKTIAVLRKIFLDIFLNLIRPTIWHFCPLS